MRDALGRSLEIVTLPSPGLVENEDGEPMPASYMNCYVSNTHGRGAHVRQPPRRRGRPRRIATLLPGPPDGGQPRARDPDRRRRVPLHHAAGAGGGEGGSRWPARSNVAVLQCALGGARERNVARVEELVREAAARGANVILPPELFEGPYFCKVEDEDLFAEARPVEGNETIARFSALASELGVVDPGLVLREGRARTTTTRSR